MGQLQRDILRRHGLAIAGMLLFTLVYITGYKIEYEIEELNSVLVLFSVFWFGQIFLVSLVWSGVSKRFKDPSLTLPMMLWIITLVSMMMFAAPALRSIIMLGFLNVLAFGVFRLSWREFIGVSLYTVACYTLVVFGINYTRSGTLMPELEALTGIAFLTSIFVYALTGREFTVLRRAYREKNQELRRALARIEELAVTDELTGLNNRRYLLRTLEKQRALSNRESLPFVLAFVDIDNFKTVNDDHGHRIGDQVLAELSHLLRVSIREVDLAARYGGEEFVLLLSGLSLEAASSVLERIRISIESSKLSEAELTLTVSIGVAQYHNGEEGDELLNRADRLLYKAKRAGRNRVELESGSTLQITS
ncbi:GGDEF domain-containing protein [Thalassolituus sp.]|jgi:diguanylate cyclase (GGDEF)-like protein|uniref:GGDEF domain-containing protein n=1 Tax=Thalassolituus sp. TaxID=2030822 RepID=UPI002A7F8125|nr:GGDEF domain-containing protein [Thalassolituus sp.]|tara:strand:+ start:3362 stop:4453 length:1092 start_codon:yes stop_codon:yes gene_type:complete